MKEGLDGYKFLDKIVQLPFYIPAIDKGRKSTYMQRILMQEELNDPIRVYKRVQYLFEGKVLQSLDLENDADFLLLCDSSHGAKTIKASCHQDISDSASQNDS